MKLNFIPFKSVGYINLGDTIDKYVLEYDFDYYPDKEDIGIDTYDLADIGISLNVRINTNVIEFISCSKTLYYLEKNIINMEINEFIEHSNQNYYGEIDEIDFEDDNVSQFVYEFDNIGLQIWTKNNIIITAIASCQLQVS